ncbi:MAG: IS200/IS605 family transposase [Prevotellaceae bacterium]|jgi:REP element-mobilizing transposase RayT|nr:IS200/IS605 family transposase [Prevotellaceae bacterium]
MQVYNFWRSDEQRVPCCLKGRFFITAGRRPAGEAELNINAMSYTRLLYHIVFRTKHSKNTIPEAHAKELYAYIMKVIADKKSRLYRIGGTENHFHLLVDIHPAFAVSDVMQVLKEYSSKWLSGNPNFPQFEGWAVSFAAFTYNLNDKQKIINYIKNQKEHHKTVNFAEEYRQFLIDNGIDIDERYFLKD